MRTLVLNAGFEPLRSSRFGAPSCWSSPARPPCSPTPASPRTRRAPSGVTLQHPVGDPAGPLRAGAPTAAASPVTRRGVLRRDGHRCAYCRGHAATVDHVVPRSRGGADTWANLVACCLRCNGVKGDRTPDEMGWRLQVRPHAPAGPAWALRGAEAVDPLWEEFLGVAA